MSPFDAVGVGVLRRGQAALRERELAKHVVERLLDDPVPALVPRHRPRVEVRRGQEGVVVEHLLEVRHEPAVVDRVAVEAASDQVIHASRGHAVERLGDQVRRLLGVAPEEELERRGGRKLRRAAEAAEGRLERPRNRALGLAEHPGGERLGRRRDA